MGFKERLKALRKESGQTQNDLASVLSYGYTAISNYESGRNEPSLSDLSKIAKYFEVSLDYIAGINDIRNPYVERILGEKIENLLQLFLECEPKNQDEVLNFLNWTLDKQKNINTTKKSLKIASTSTPYELDK